MMTTTLRVVRAIGEWEVERELLLPSTALVTTILWVVKATGV
jgi:hypothetical protein